MPILIRRISMGKWKDYCLKVADSQSLVKRFLKYPQYNAPADAITNCLKTYNNQLSMWLLPDEESLNEVLLALCTGTKANSPSSIEYVRIDTKELEALGLTFAPSKDDADTAIPELKELHYDVSGFNYNTLGFFQDLIVKRIRRKETTRKIASELKPLVLDAIRKNRIDYASLSDDYKRFLKESFPDETGIPDLPSDSVVCPNCGSEISVA